MLFYIKKQTLLLNFNPSIQSIKAVKKGIIVVKKDYLNVARLQNVSLVESAKIARPTFCTFEAQNSRTINSRCSNLQVCSSHTFFTNIYGMLSEMFWGPIFFFFLALFEMELPTCERWNAVSNSICFFSFEERRGGGGGILFFFLFTGLPARSQWFGFRVLCVISFSSVNLHVRNL